MKRALFISKNLLGDGLNIAPALRAWAKREQTPLGEEIHILLLTNNDSIQDIYRRMDVGEFGVNVITEIEEKDKLTDLDARFPVDTEYKAFKLDRESHGRGFDFIFNFDVNQAFQIGHQQKVHITEAYAKMLGVEIDTYAPTYITTEEEHEKNLILFSIFSKSCSSNEGKPPNKMLPWPKVRRLLDMVREKYPDNKIGILGGPDDRAEIDASEDEYYCGLPLNKVALMLRDCKFLITIDNGISHLAASQQTKSIVLYPECLDVRWIAPKGNANALVLQMNPATVQTANLLWNIKQSLEVIQA